MRNLLMASKHSEIWIRLNPSKYSCHLEKFESCFTIISQWNLPLTWLSPCPLLEHYSVKLTDSNIPHSNFNFKTNSGNFAQKQKMSRNTHACWFYMPATWMNIDLNMKSTHMAINHDFKIANNAILSRGNSAQIKQCSPSCCCYNAIHTIMQWL